MGYLPLTSEGLCSNILVALHSLTYEVHSYEQCVNRHIALLLLLLLDKTNKAI